MKPCVTIVVFLLAINLIDSTWATSLGSKPLNVRQIEDLPVACLPENEGESIALNAADVAADDSVEGPKGRWAIELVPGAKPLTLHPGECVAFGKLIDGYRQVGEIQPLEEGKTYSFGLRRGDRINDWVSKLYVGVFCVMRLSDGRLAYLPYVDHPDGTTTYPPCGHYIGSPPAPDGINPPRQ